MTEQELYNYYYNYFVNDLDKVLHNGSVRRFVTDQAYIGGSSKKAADRVGELPKDQQSRDIMKRAAEAALKDKGYKSSRTWLPTFGLYGGRQLYGATAAKAALDMLTKKETNSDRPSLVDPNALQQDPNQLALNIISALKAGQPIDSYIAMVPEGADDLYKSAFIYTLASNYPAKTPEVSKEMQALAARHQLKAQQWKVSRQSKFNLNDTQTMLGLANRDTAKGGKN